MAGKKNHFVEPVIDDVGGAVATPVEESATARDAVLPREGYNTIDLPSNGNLGYPRYVEYRDMLVRDEEVLASATQETYLKTLNGVLKSILGDCSFYEDMSVHDRDFMLIWVWANNYTSKKEIPNECRNCGHHSIIKVDLTKLPSTAIREDFKDHVEIPIKKTGGKIIVRHPTVRDELMANEYVNRNNLGQDRYEFVMNASTIDLGVAVPFERKIEWVKDNLTAREMAIVKAFHAKYAFGIDQTISHECGKCGEVARGIIPFQASDILFPAVPDDLAELV